MLTSVTCRPSIFVVVWPNGLSNATGIFLHRSTVDSRERDAAAFQDFVRAPQLNWEGPVGGFPISVLQQRICPRALDELSTESPWNGDTAAVPVAVDVELEIEEVCR